MGQGTDNWNEKDDHQFIKETIKKKPSDKKRIAGRIASIAGGGILFGSCAAAAWIGVIPVLEKQFDAGSRKEDVEIVTTLPQAGQLEDEENIAVSSSLGKSERTIKSPLEAYGELYSEVLRVSEEPRRALVTVQGISENEDLLDNSRLSCSSSEGIIFLETHSFLYILTYEDSLDDMHNIQVTFADGSGAAGQLCKEDVQSGIAVVTVKKAEIREETLANIFVADLGGTYNMQQTSPVIAIGSPAGDKNAVLYGMVTSLSETFPVVDAEYYVLATDTQGSKDGNGMLIDSSGNVIGMIIKQDTDKANTVRALLISQLRPLIEKLSNGSPIMYAGIYGKTISEKQSESLQIPVGIYVERVENHSPAMAAGIQSGDIICAMDEEEIRDMQVYSERLQEKKAGDKAELTIMRKDAENQYVKMEFSITIEER